MPPPPLPFASSRILFRLAGFWSRLLRVELGSQSIQVCNHACLFARAAFSSVLVVVVCLVVWLFLPEVIPLGSTNTAFTSPPPPLTLMPDPHFSFEQVEVSQGYIPKLVLVDSQGLSAGWIMAAAGW